MVFPFVLIYYSLAADFDECSQYEWVAAENEPKANVSMLRALAGVRVVEHIFCQNASRTNRKCGLVSPRCLEGFPEENSHNRRMCQAFVGHAPCTAHSTAAAHRYWLALDESNWLAQSALTLDSTALTTAKMCHIDWATATRALNIYTILKL